MALFAFDVITRTIIRPPSDHLCWDLTAFALIAPTMWLNVSAQWEWFLSIILRYVSIDEWHHSVLSFYHFTPESSAINTVTTQLNRSHPITTAYLSLLITVRSGRLRSNSPNSTRSHLSQYPPPSHLCCPFPWSNGHPFCSSILSTRPCRPCPLTTLFAWRRRVTSLSVPTIDRHQQPCLTNSMAKGEKDRAQPCDWIYQLWNFTDMSTPTT